MALAKGIQPNRLTLQDTGWKKIPQPKGAFISGSIINLSTSVVNIRPTKDQAHYYTINSFGSTGDRITIDFDPSECYIQRTAGTDQVVYIEYKSEEKISE